MFSGLYPTHADVNASILAMEEISFDDETVSCKALLRLSRSSSVVTRDSIFLVSLISDLSFSVPSTYSIL